MSGVFSTAAGERAKEGKARDELRRQQQRVEHVEKFSGLRVKNRLVASAVLEDKFCDLRFTRIPDLRHDLHGRWATAGVLVEKTVKQGSTGSSYSVWRLSDMSPTDYTVSVFLFGQAHLDFSKEDPGSVWCVVDGELREDTGQKSHQASRPTVAVNEPRMLCKLGVSPVFGRCKGLRKDGNDCTMHVNLGVSEYCAYHASAALKSLATERMALGPGRAPKFVRNGKTVMGAKGMGGRMNQPPPPGSDAARELQRARSASGVVAFSRPAAAYTDRSDDQIKRAALKQTHNSMTGRGAALVSGGAVGGKRANPGLSHKPRDEDNRTGRAAGLAMAGRDNGSVGKVSPQVSGRFGDDRKLPGGMMSKTELLSSKKARVDNGGTTKLDSGFGGGFGGGRDEPVPGVKSNASSSRKPVGGANRVGAFPTKLSPRKHQPAQFVMEIVEDDTFDCDLDLLDTLTRAKTVAKALAPHDPNTRYDNRPATKTLTVDFRGAATRVAPPPLPGLAPGASKRVGTTGTVAGMENELGTTHSGTGIRSNSTGAQHISTHVPKPAPPGSFGDVFGSIAAATMDADSQYTKSAEDLTHDAMLKTLGNLEKADALHTQVSNTFFLTVKCSRCECGVLFEGRQREKCQASAHRAYAHETKKRFFKCGAGNCYFRTTTLGKPFPSMACPKCRCEDWDKCCVSANAERQKGGAGYDEEVGNAGGMLARGVEHDFSLRAGGGFGGGGHLTTELDRR